jgi:uncharacterized protein YbjT (DUF2867 family)
MSDKIIAVLGATGAQGGGLARAILDDAEGPFRLRALTRNPTSDAARALAEAGAEVVEADMDDADSLRRAFDGAHGVFAVTNFWEHFSPEKELEQAGNIVTAAKDAGVHHVIWSTLEDTRLQVPLDDDRMPTLQGKYKVPHFDAKGEANALFEEAGVPTTYFHASFYWDNLIHFGMGPQRGEDGVLRFVLPMADAKLPGIGTEDIGRCAYGIFKGGDEWIGRKVGVAGEHLSGAEMAAALTDALGEPVEHAAVSPDTYRSFGFPGADDLGNMFQHHTDFEDEVRGMRSVETARKLNPELQDFSTWLGENAGRMAVK